MKNILIISLLVTNIATVMLLHNSAHQELFTLIKNKFGQELQSTFQDRNEMYKMLKEDILKFYKPSATNCKAAASFTKQSEFAGTAMMDMACLIADKRKIAWATTQEIADLLIEQILAFEYVSQFENIQEIHGISYRPEGKRSALLLAKLKLIENTKGNPKYFGEYLTGTLLGYDPADIAFFYQRIAFRVFLQKENPNIEIPFSYANFSLEFKKRFDVFIEQNWPHSKMNKEYLADIAEAKNWLNEQSAYSEEELLEQVKALEKANN